MDHKAVQGIARQTMDFARERIRPGMRLTEFRELLEAHMRALGAEGFWYWGIGAFVFAGDDTAVSVSGRTYVTSEREIAPEDLITIDLSPQAADCWGDFARTLVLEGGAVVPPKAVRREEWRQGLEMEEALRQELLRFARPETTFEELSVHMNALIRARGFVNLDFRGNLGHSIVRRMEERIFIEPGNGARLGDVELFTFEPHISLRGSKYGFKREDIYRFEGGRPVAL